MGEQGGVRVGASLRGEPVVAVREVHHSGRKETDQGADAHDEERKAEAKGGGAPEEGGLTNLQYAPIAELTGRSIQLAPQAFNCAAPDTGNMEVLHMFGTDEQKERWLPGICSGELITAIAMTEPGIGSDLASMGTTAIRVTTDSLSLGISLSHSLSASLPLCLALSHSV